MKVRSKILIPVTLGLMMSACSTSSSQQTESVITPEVSNAESSVASTHGSELENEVASKEVLIQSLQQKLFENKKRLASLNQSLDEKDNVIASLQKSSSNAENLAALEEQKKSRETLESRYTALKLDNDLLTRRINQLENENNKFLA